MERVEAETIERQRLAQKGAVDKKPAMAWTQGCTEWDPQEQAEIELAEANALALAEAADALELEAELLEEAEKRSHRRSAGSSVVRGAVAGLTAFGLNAIFDDDE